MPIEMRMFTQAELLAARFWFHDTNIKCETIAERTGISVAEIEVILESKEYREAVERLILSTRTPRKLREWIDTTSPIWLARRMRLPETVVLKMIERIRGVMMNDTQKAARSALFSLK